MRRLLRTATTCSLFLVLAVLSAPVAHAAGKWVLDKEKTKLLEGGGEKAILWQGRQIGKHTWTGNGYVFNYSGSCTDGHSKLGTVTGTITMTPPPATIIPGQQVSITWTVTATAGGEGDWGSVIAMNLGGQGSQGGVSFPNEPDGTMCTGVQAVAGGEGRKGGTSTKTQTGKLHEGAVGDEWYYGALVGCAQDRCEAMIISLKYKWVEGAGPDDKKPEQEKPKPTELRAVPSFAGPGSMLEVDLQGNAPLSDGKVDFGRGITQYGEPTEKGLALNCRIKVAPDAPLGEREVKVTFPDGATSKATFTVHPLVVVIDIDALRPDVFEAAVRGGQAEGWWERLKGNATRPPVPQLSRLLGKPLQPVGGPPRCLEFEHGVLVQDTITTFPSYTFPAQASFVTGVEPGVHGLPGNAIFDRATQTNFGFDGAESQTTFGSQAKAVYSSGLASDQLQVPTIYEQLPVSPLVIWHQFAKGVIDDRWKRADLIDQGLYMLQSTTQAYDRNAIEEMLKVLNRLGSPKDPPLAAGKLPGLIWLYLTSVDHYGHSKDETMVGRQLVQYCDYVDGYLKDVFDYFDRYPGTIFLVVSDHGQTDTRTAQDIGWAKWRRILGDKYAMWTPETSVGRCDTVVRLDGGVAHVYLNAVSAADEADCANNWPKAPSFERVVELGDRIGQWDHLGIAGLPAGPYFDLILVRNAERDGWDGPYQVLVPSTLDEPRPRTEDIAAYLRRTNNAFGVRLGWQNTPEDIAFIAERFNCLSCQRAGDILVLPHYPGPQPREGENYYHFTGDNYAGQHGSFSTDDMRMTFAIAQPKRENASGLVELLRTTLADPARPRILDVSTTVAALCGERFRGKLHVAQQGNRTGTQLAQLPGTTPTQGQTQPAPQQQQPASLPPADVNKLAGLAGKIIITADGTRQAEALAALAGNTSARGEFALAETMFIKALQADPNSVTTWVGLGDSYMAKERYEDAVKVLQVAVRLAPRNPTPHHELAMALYEAGKRAEALKEALQAKELGDPDAEDLIKLIQPWEE